MKALSASISRHIWSFLWLGKGEREKENFLSFVCSTCLFLFFTCVRMGDVHCFLSLLPLFIKMDTPDALWWKGPSDAQSVGWTNQSHFIQIPEENLREPTTFWVLYITVCSQLLTGCKGCASGKWEGISHRYQWDIHTVYSTHILYKKSRLLIGTVSPSKSAQ